MELRGRLRRMARCRHRLCCLGRYGVKILGCMTNKQSDSRISDVDGNRILLGALEGRFGFVQQISENLVVS